MKEVLLPLLGALLYVIGVVIYAKKVCEDSFKRFADAIIKGTE